MWHHRYSAFADLDKNLRRNAPARRDGSGGKSGASGASGGKSEASGAWVKALPTLPGKNLFALNAGELEGRRAGLEKYMRGLCTAAVLGDDSAKALVENFLLYSDDDPEATMDINVVRVREQSRR